MAPTEYEDNGGGAKDKAAAALDTAGSAVRDCSARRCRTPAPPVRMTPAPVVGGRAGG